MKHINYKWILTLGIAGLIFWLARYLTRSRTYSLEEMSAFLTTCGSFIQEGFKNDKPEQSDYVIVLLSVLVVIVTLYYSIKYLIRPNEKNGHIKYKILEDETKC